MFGIAVLMNFFIDYLSNALSLSLLRMAALSGKLFDTLLAQLAQLEGRFCNFARGAVNQINWLDGARS
jgi:hypothetical protein